MKREGNRVNVRRRWAFGLMALLFGIACGREAAPPSESSDLRTESQALGTPPVTKPCELRGAAVTATTGKVIVNSATTIDAYDSGTGGYGGQNAFAGGTVRAATDIVANGGNITGSQVPRSPSSYQVPAVPSNAKKLPLGASTPGNVNINSASNSITLSPGNYVVKNMTISFPGKLSISPAGEVNIFVLENLNLGGTENQNGKPKNLTFFVKSTATVNVNTSGKLFGSILAPRSVVNLSSQVFGYVVGKEVTLNSGSAVHHDQTLRCPAPPIATTPPRPLPLPPKEKGCYIGTANGWATVPCTTNDELSEDIDAPEPTINSFANPTTIPLEYGEVDMTFATFGELADDGRSGLDSLTVQANTNIFTRTTGQQGWVQFVAHALRVDDPNNTADSAACIWEFVQATSPFDYFVTCVGGSTNQNSNSDIRHISRREGTFQQFDFATVGGSSFIVNGEARLGMVARMSWFDPNVDPGSDRGLYSVVVQDRTGLRGNWTDMSGGVFSARSGGVAAFTNTSAVTRILAGSCANAAAPKPDIPWPGLCPTQPPLLPSTQIIETNPTAERSNLMLVGTPFVLASVTPDLVFTQFMESTNGQCLPGAERAYVKDHPSDTGVVPSNADGQPFWQSPDIFIVPENAVVNPTAPAPPIVITPGQMYDAYVRVNNDYSCSPITGVKARIHLADPAALSVAWGPVTQGTDYVGPESAPNGITVEPGQRALVGPFTFQAPTSNTPDAHRCVLASIITDTQPAPTDPLDAPGSFQVAQRNLSFQECVYPLTNATLGSGNLELTLSVSGGMPSLSGGNEISMTFFDPAQAWYQAWLPGQGTAYSMTHVNGETTVRLGQPSVTLAPVLLGAGVTVTAEGTVNLTTGEVETTLSLGAVLRGSEGEVLVSNGGSCVRQAPVSPPPPEEPE